MKGFLILHDQSFPRTHDIRLLIQLAIVIESQFERYQDTSELLTPYATEFRYPSDVMQPTAEELQEAIKQSTELFDFVASLLPTEISSYLR
jgi:HEPN domain-containing protein